VGTVGFADGGGGGAGRGVDAGVGVVAMDALAVGGRDGTGLGLATVGEGWGMFGAEDDATGSPALEGVVEVATNMGA